MSLCLKERSHVTAGFVMVSSSESRCPWAQVVEPTHEISWGIVNKRPAKISQEHGCLTQALARWLLR